MVKTIVELSTKFPPKWKGQKAWCEEIHAWIYAVPSASGKGYRWLLPPMPAIEDNA